MEDNKKMEQLLQIIEHPQDFSEQQKDDILSDEEWKFARQWLLNRYRIAFLMS